MHMVGVHVSVEHRIDGADPGCQQLQAQLGRSVDQQPRPAGFDHRGGPGALIP
jgi:hypothetical protein